MPTSRNVTNEFSKNMSDCRGHNPYLLAISQDLTINDFGCHSMTTSRCLLFQDCPNIHWSQTIPVQANSFENAYTTYTHNSARDI
jgi:hypothetical protein